VFPFPTMTEETGSLMSSNVGNAVAKSSDPGSVEPQVADEFSERRDDSDESTSRNPLGDFSKEFGKKSPLGASNDRVKLFSLTLKKLVMFLLISRSRMPF